MSKDFHCSATPQRLSTESLSKLRALFSEQGEKGATIFHQPHAEELLAMAWQCKTCEAWNHQTARTWWEAHLPELSGPLTIIEPDDMRVAAY